MALLLNKDWRMIIMAGEDTSHGDTSHGDRILQFRKLYSPILRFTLAGGIGRNGLRRAFAICINSRVSNSIIRYQVFLYCRGSFLG